MCAVAGMLAVTAFAAATPAAAAADPQGSAYALSVDTTLLDAPLVSVPPVPVVTYPQGGSESVAELGPTVNGAVSAKALNASSTLGRGGVVSEASIAEVDVRNVVSARAVTAECHIGEDGPVGTAAVAELVVFGQALVVDTEPTVIEISDVATVYFNEQVRDGDALTVNAIRVSVRGLTDGILTADVILAQAKCSGTTQVTEPPTTTTTTEPPTTTPSLTEPSTPTATTPGRDGSVITTSDAVVGVERTSNDEDLAATGVSAIGSLSIGALVLIVGGVAVTYLARRRRTSSDS